MRKYSRDSVPIWCTGQEEVVFPGLIFINPLYFQFLTRQIQATWESTKWTIYDDNTLANVCHGIFVFCFEYGINTLFFKLTEYHSTVDRSLVDELHSSDLSWWINAHSLLKTLGISVHFFLLVVNSEICISLEGEQEPRKNDCESSIPAATPIDLVAPSFVTGYLLQAKGLRSIVDRPLDERLLFCRMVSHYERSLCTLLLDYLSSKIVSCSAVDP